MTKKLTDSQITELVEKYQNGESTIQLGKYFQLDPTSIRGLLVRRNIQLRTTWNRKKPHRPAIDRFWEKVNKNGPIMPHMNTRCWLWTAYKNKARYGVFGAISENTCLAHRFSYELHFGAFSKEIKVLHKCDNPTCVNPDHLYLGTHQDNTNDRMKRNRHKVLLGEDNPASKLNRELAKEIRRRYETEKTSCKKLSKDYSVSATAIHQIVTNKTWREQ